MKQSSARTPTHYSEAGNIVGAALVLGLFAILLTWFLREGVVDRLMSDESGFHAAVNNLANSDLDLVTINSAGELRPSDRLSVHLQAVSDFFLTTTGALSASAGLFVTAEGSPGSHARYSEWQLVDCRDAGGTDPNNCTEIIASLPELSYASVLSTSLSYRLGVMATYEGGDGALIGEIPVSPRLPGNSSAPFIPVFVPGPSGIPNASASPSATP
jgi:hypothetical protein